MLGGSPAYEVWFEIVPKAPEYVQMTLKPGDSVTASVTASGNGQFTLFIRDNTTHTDFSTVQPSAGAELVTAEVVAEAPATISGPSPLPDFGTVRFTNARANGRPIGTFTWDRLSMSSGTVPQADTSALARDAGSFSVTWPARVDPHHPGTVSLLTHARGGHGPVPVTSTSREDGRSWQTITTRASPRGRPVPQRPCRICRGLGCRSGRCSRRCC